MEFTEFGTFVTLERLLSPKMTTSDWMSGMCHLDLSLCRVMFGPHTSLGWCVAGAGLLVGGDGSGGVAGLPGSAGKSSSERGKSVFLLVLVERLSTGVAAS